MLKHLKNSGCRFAAIFVDGRWLRSSMLKLNDGCTFCINATTTGELNCKAAAVLCPFFKRRCSAAEFRLGKVEFLSK